MKNGARPRVILYVAGLVAFLSVPSTSKAASFNINDLINGTITISANDFGNGFSVNLTLLQRGLGSPASITLSESSGTVSFRGSWLGGGAPTTNSNTVYFTEGPSNVISDILTWSASTNRINGTITGTFQSSDSGLGTIPLGATTWNENLGAFTFDQPFLTASAQSAPTPEPSTLVLLGAGLLGLAGVTRLRMLF